MPVDYETRPMIMAGRNDPSLPRVVTFKDHGKGWTERIESFPDGSVNIDLLPPLNAEPAAAAGEARPTGADQAAQRFAEAQAGRLLHDPAAGWYAFDGVAWRRDRGAVPWRIREALRAAGHDDPGPALVAAVDAFARQEPTLRTSLHAGDGEDPLWDADPWRLGTPGGTVDLATGALRPADPADRITRTTAVAPAETADCPLWRRFLDDSMAGDAGLVGFLQRFCGYALTGETCELALFYGLGEGGNGKSVFVNTVRGILGTYAAVAAPDLFAQGAERRAGKAHSAEVAMLAGARLVTASETEEGRVWADGRLKLLTGDDPVTARFCGRDHFTFTPRFKLIVVGNHMPVLRTVDAAIRRRLCVVPFACRPAVPDRRLEHKLREEWPGILRWMIEGCVAWAAEGEGSGQEGGLLRPAAVEAATDAYLGGQDLVGQFLADWCERGGTYLETSGDLYKGWRAYAHAAGEEPGSQRRFSARLERAGLVRERLMHARIYRGVRLVRPGERAAEVYAARKVDGFDAGDAASRVSPC